jgi:hypothetical protein
VGFSKFACPAIMRIEVIGGNPCSRRSSENDYRF